ncbi:hypothetical protein G9C85_07560 [Halorubellus sp. JP-L1]|uniref:hypothetical protein n=1 Tax=Halorubellus sp. JP-L1 TaxID=2715753 RepID=UPI00140B8F16|nr:hypothetical protein [Halorubellus sp. JP-L1]NHN41493.1 hypothetical protein [Halorubellus sp. JP-L1]
MVLDLFVAAGLGVMLVAVVQTGTAPMPTAEPVPHVLGATTAAATVAYSIGSFGTLRGYALLAAAAVVAFLAVALRTPPATSAA